MIAEEVKTYEDFTVYGATEEVWYGDDDCLLEGPAGTGKTLGLLHYLNYLCINYPGSQWLLFRKHRVDMTEPVLRLMEEEVLGPGHPAIVGTAQRANRDFYHYPNGSHIVVMGMGVTQDEGANRVMSASFDGAFGIESTELTPDDVEKVSSRLRGRATPHQRLILDCNPGNQFHHLNIRANRGLIRRMMSVHEDNPRLYDHELNDWTAFGKKYLERLDKLSGARRERLKKGLWVSEEGMILEDAWDPKVHCVEGEFLYDWHDEVSYVNVPRNGHPYTEPTRGQCRGIHITYPFDRVVDFAWTFAAMDWGWTHPGVLQVWGVEKDRTMWRIAVWYRTGKTLDWWAEKAVEARKEFDIKAIVCDPSRPENIEKFNDRLGSQRSRDVPGIAREAENAWMTGLDQVREALAPQDGGPVKMYFVQNVLRTGRDPIHDLAGKPCCFEEEVQGLVWRKHQDGRPNKEEMQPGLTDDEFDTTRYAAMYNWKRDLEQPKRGPMFALGTLGDLLGHEDVLKGRFKDTDRNGRRTRRR